MEYLTSTDVQIFIGKTLSTADTAKLGIIIPGLSAAIEAFCHRSWISGNETNIVELFIGPKTIVYPKNAPISSVVSLKINDIASTDFVTRKQWIEVSLSESDEAELTYRSSASFPSDLKLALVQWAANFLSDSSSPNGRAVKRVQTGPVSVEYVSVTDIPEFVSSIAKKYIRLSL